MTMFLYRSNVLYMSYVTKCLGVSALPSPPKPKVYWVLQSLHMLKFLDAENGVDGS